MLCKIMLNSSDSESRTDSDNEDDINQLDSSGDVSSQSSSDQDVCIKGNCNIYIYINSFKAYLLLFWNIPESIISRDG